jgi:hypothetical protein
MVQDTREIKEKIISILKRKGPSLPVHISREIESSILFTSAFLSELVSEKLVLISKMKVGSSPIYFLPGQESLIEKYSPYLKSKEKEAFMLLKEKGILKDDKQNPAIRVALREIRDFAVPFKKEDEIFWRYHTLPEERFTKKEEKPEVKIKKEEPKKEKDLGIFEKEKPKKKKIKKKSASKNEKFFNKVKEFLSERSIELSDIESFDKNKLVLKIKEKGDEKMLIAYNKKRITENDIIKAYKKAKELNMSYVVLSLGEPLKKMSGLIEAVKNLSSIEKIK